MRRLGWLICLLSAMIHCGAGAALGDTLQPRAKIYRRTFAPPPPGWEVLGVSRKSSTRHCIGSVVTPECAVVTEMACLLWHRADLCHLSRGPLGKDDDWRPARPDHLVKYRIIESRPFGGAARDPKSVPGPWEAHAASLGARWRVTIVEQDCYFADGDCPSDVFVPDYYYLAPVRRGWFIVFRENPKLPEPNSLCAEFDLYPPLPVPEICRSFSSDLVPVP